MAERTITLTSPRIRTTSLKEGTNVLKDTGDLKLIAEVKRGKITALTAEDPKGKKLKVSTLRETALPRPAPAAGTAAGAKVTCWACVETPAGRFCWEINCDDLPKPKLAQARR
jgi:hypothetical protein